MKSAGVKKRRKGRANNSEEGENTRFRGVKLAKKKNDVYNEGRGGTLLGEVSMDGKGV